VERSGPLPVMEGGSDAYDGEERCRLGGREIRPFSAMESSFRWTIRGAGRAAP
jgi:hypothetical protein